MFPEMAINGEKSPWTFKFCLLAEYGIAEDKL